MKRFYLIPATVVNGERQPAYLSNWSAIDYGSHDVFLASSEVTTQEHQAITANPDVISVPQNLDATIGANANAAQTALESFSIPSEWIQSSMTWRQALKIVASIFHLSQRYFGLYGASLVDDVVFNNAFSSHPAEVRSRLLGMSDSFNFDRSGLTGGMTIRQILTALRVQITYFIRLGGEDL